MTHTQKVIVAGATGAIGLATLFGAGSVAAQTADTQANPMTSLVQSLASKFNLKEADVQAVFDEQRATMDAQRTTREAERLQQAVDDGDLTAEQRDKIVAKRAELEAARDANRDSQSDQTPAERRAAMTAERDSLEQWAEDNDIPTEYLMGRGGPGGHGGRGGFGPPADRDPSETEGTTTTK